MMSIIIMVAFVMCLLIMALGALFSMSEKRAQPHRGVPNGRAIYYGRATITIEGASDTSGTKAVTYDPTYRTEPHVIISIPEHSTDGSSTYVSRSWVTSKSSTGFTLNAEIDQAAGLYKTTTLQFDYAVIATAKNDPQA